MVACAPTNTPHSGNLAATQADTHTRAPAPPACGPVVVEPFDVVVDEANPPVPQIVDAHHLAPFFDAAAALLNGKRDRPVRIAVYGDSNLTMDFQTGQIRRNLQQRYGDAGHGFVALGRPWSHYQHMDVQHDVKSGFTAYVVTTKPLLDRGYGLSGIAVESAWGQATTWVATAEPDAPIGHKVSRVETYYLRAPGFGTFDVIVDDKLMATVDTGAKVRGLGTHRLKLEDSAHHIRFVASHPRKRVRLLGAVLERDVASFVIDSFGVGALNSRAMANEDPTINKPMLAERRYDLIVFMTGANDVFTLDETPGHMKKIIALQRDALGEVPILIVTPADRGKRGSFPLTIQAVEQRKKIAKDNGTALWDLWTAMGGKSSMARFGHRGLAHFDFIHFNQEGGAWVGDRLTSALWLAFANYVEAHPQAGCNQSD